MAEENQSPYDAVIADLENKRDQIATAIEMLRAIRSGGFTFTLPSSANSQRPVVSEADIPHDAFFGMTIPEAAKKYLSIGKTTKTNPELCNALIKGGFKTTSANFSEVVRSTLQRNSDFRKVNGQWGLAEWYGGRGGVTRRSRKTLVEQLSDGQKEQEPSEVDSDGSMD